MLGLHVTDAIKAIQTTGSRVICTEIINKSTSLYLINFHHRTALVLLAIVKLQNSAGNALVICKMRLSKATDDTMQRKTFSHASFF